MPVDAIPLLEELAPLSSLPKSALAEIAKLVRCRDFAPGERIIARGDPGDAMYIIASGEVRVPILDASGREKMIAKLSRGQFFGEMALMTGDPRTADVFAEGPVSALVIEKEGFHKITRETPSLARFLTQILAHRLTEGGFMASKTIGKYQLLGELGRGGMSVVYNAVHISLNRPVAVKMLSHELAFDECFRASFQQEARIIAGLSHENIVQVYDTEQAYATYFIMMEFIAGTSLAKLIEASGRLPASQVRDILIQMCRALGFAHDRGIVHRDVKPSNVIMTPDGRVKLMDFGLARVQAAEPKPEDEEVVGTVEYMSPEQIRGLAVDRRTDIYALGIVAFEMLSGDVPFRAENPYEVLRAHVTEPLPPLRERAAGVPEDLVQFVERATRKDPAERFQTLEEAERLLTQRRAAGLPSVREGKVITIFYAPSEAGSVERAVAELRQSLIANPNVRMATSTLTAPT